MKQFTESAARRARLLRAIILLAGLTATQVFLYGPSLAGTKILLPLDILADRGCYLPATPEYAGIQPRDFVLSDEVLQFEFERRFATTEFRSGRLPLWNPYVFLGAPFAFFDKYSPFNIYYYICPVPLALAWIQLVKSLVAGAGSYVFFRRILDVGFWPAVIGAWCYPLTGFFTLWQGYPHSSVTTWLPWVFLATDSVLRRPLGLGGPALAMLTCLVLVTRIDVGCQVMLAAGMYALWRLWDRYGRSRSVRGALGPVTALAGAWALGFMLAGPHLLSLAEYTRSSSRIPSRAAGREDRPVGGVYELPRTVLPDVYGSTQHGAYLLVPGNLLESGAATYTGLLATLLLAPLAWCSPRHRSINWFWVLLSVLALAWVLDIPVLVSLLRLPGLNLMSHNRFVFAASFAILALAVVGLDVVWRGGPGRSWWFALPMLAIVVLGAWCWFRALGLPEPLASQLESDVQAGISLPNVPDLAALALAREGYLRSQVYGVFLCGLALCGWLVVCLGWARHRWCGPALAALLLAELHYFAHGRNPQCEPALYYPRLPVLERLAEAPPGRVLGYSCLPANLAMSHGLRDVRGYDSIDPKLLIELLERVVRDPHSKRLPYARVQQYVPLAAFSASGKIELPPLLSMLGVRYVIFRGTPPDNVQPFASAPDYWAVENPEALPRAFVPSHVEWKEKGGGLLTLLGAPTFDPRRVAYVDRSVSLPDNCRGTVTVVEESSTQVVLAANMETPGLVVLCDLWYPGWNAYQDGEPVEILRTNHAVRGVVLPSGFSTLVFRYEPASFRWGVRAMVTAIVLLGAWLAGGWWLRRRSARSADGSGGHGILNTPILVE
jgi:hypothetical protein